MTTDLCYATATVADCASHPDAVDLVVSHALTQVVFRVKAASYTSAVSMSLNSLSLAGIYSVGDFNSASANKWSGQESAQTYTLSNSVTTLTYTGTTPDVIDICSYVYIPQELGANAAISLSYSITQNVNSTDYTLTTPITIPLGGAITEWEAGKKYIYTLNIGPDLITFSASALGWTEVDHGIVVE